MSSTRCRFRKSKDSWPYTEVCRAEAREGGINCTEHQNQEIVTAVSEYLELREGESGLLQGRCPFHDDQGQSLQASPQKGLFLCLECKAGGDAVTFLKLISGSDVG